MCIMNGRIIWSCILKGELQMLLSKGIQDVCLPSPCDTSLEVLQLKLVLLHLAKSRRMCLGSMSYIASDISLSP